jgi:integrase
MLAYQTGLRATELIILTIGDIHLGVGTHIGALVEARQGRKHAATPRTPTEPSSLWTFTRLSTTQDFDKSLTSCRGPYLTGCRQSPG